MHLFSLPHFFIIRIMSFFKESGLRIARSVFYLELSQYRCSDCLFVENMAAYIITRFACWCLISLKRYFRFSNDKFMIWTLSWCPILTTLPEVLAHEWILQLQWSRGQIDCHYLSFFNFLHIGVSYTQLFELKRCKSFQFTEWTIW